MVADGGLLNGVFIGGAVVLAKVGFVLFAALYFLFSLIIVRQINLMSETVITEGAPVLRALSIIHAGVALALIVFFIVAM